MFQSLTHILGHKLFLMSSSSLKAGNVLSSTNTLNPVITLKRCPSFFLYVV